MTRSLKSLPRSPKVSKDKSPPMTPQNPNSQLDGMDPKEEACLKKKKAAEDAAQQQAKQDKEQQKQQLLANAQAKMRAGTNRMESAITVMRAGVSSNPNSGKIVSAT